MRNQDRKDKFYWQRKKKRLITKRDERIARLRTYYSQKIDEANSEIEKLAKVRDGLSR